MHSKKTVKSPGTYYSPVLFVNILCSRIAENCDLDAPP